MDKDFSITDELRRASVKAKFIRAIEDVTKVEKDTVAWSIELHGSRILFKNGKGLWAKRHHAKNALTHHVFHRLKNIVKKELLVGSRDEVKLLYESLLEELERDGILVFKELR